MQEVDDDEVVPTPESARRQPETQVEYTRRFKRKAETDREQLEREIREDSEELLQTNMDFDWFWVGSGEPVLVASLGTLEGPASFAPATSPEMFSGSLDSVCFNRSNEHDFVKMRLGGQDVLVWKPDSIIDDQSLQELDLEQGFKGMQEEVRNLEHCKTGAGHAKRSSATFETSKNDPFCRTYHRHGHTGIARTVANGCERLQMVADG